METGGNIAPDQHRAQPPRQEAVRPNFAQYNQNAGYGDQYDDYDGPVRANPYNNVLPRANQIAAELQEFTPEENEYYLYRLEKGISSSHSKTSSQAC
jgi:hypothetical protein